MLITILLMIEDRCNTSFAKTACYVHISFIIGDENGCKTNSVRFVLITIQCMTSTLEAFCNTPSVLVILFWSQSSVSDPDSYSRVDH